MQHFIHFISLYLNHFASTTANNTSNRYLLYTFYLFCFLFVFLEYHVSLCAAFLKVARFEKLRVAYPAADCDLPYSARVFYLISSLARSADDSNTCHRLTATKHKYMYVVSARLSIFVCVYFCTFIYLLPSAEVSLSPLAETNVRRYCRHTLCWIHIIGAINLPYSTYTVIHTHTNTNAIVCTVTFILTFSYFYLFVFAQMHLPTFPICILSAFRTFPSCTTHAVSYLPYLLILNGSYLFNKTLPHTLTCFGMNNCSFILFFFAFTFIVVFVFIFHYSLPLSLSSSK